MNLHIVLVKFLQRQALESKTLGQLWVGSEELIIQNIFEKNDHSSGKFCLCP